jgi:hypothetical protein
MGVLTLPQNLKGNQNSRYRLFDEGLDGDGVLEFMIRTIDGDEHRIVDGWQLKSSDALRRRAHYCMKCIPQLRTIEPWWKKPSHPPVS